MKLKSLVLVVALLAVLSAVVYFVRRPGPPAAADARVGQPLANAATLEKAAKLRLTDQGKTVSLAKQADGTWAVTSYYDLPVDVSKLSRFVGDLTDAKLQRLVTSSPERIARLEFKDTQITFLDSADKELWSVTLGKTADSGGRFVRFGNEPKAYLATLSAWLDVDAKNWADTQLINVKADDIAKVQLSFPEESGKTVTATRAKKEDAFTTDQTPDGKKLKPEMITTLLSSLTTLRFTDTVEPTDPQAVAAKENARTVKLTTFDGKTFSISLGRKPEQKIVKAPVPSKDAAKNGPAALLPAAAPASEEKSDTKPAAPTGDGPGKTLEPTTETVPAGPVYVSIAYPDPKAPGAALMQKRAVATSEYVFTGLPQKSDELFEPIPPATPAVPSPKP